MSHSFLEREVLNWTVLIMSSNSSSTNSMGLAEGFLQVFRTSFTFRSLGEYGMFNGMDEGRA